MYTLAIKDFKISPIYFMTSFIRRTILVIHLYSWAINRILDGIDGVIARKRNMYSIIWTFLERILIYSDYIFLQNYLFIIENKI